MKVKQLLLVFTVVLVTFAQAPQLKEQIDTFLKSSQSLPEIAEMTDFKQVDGKYIVLYTQGATHFKYVLKKDQEGKFHIVFMEKITSITATFTSNDRKPLDHRKPLKHGNSLQTQIPFLLPEVFEEMNDMPPMKMMQPTEFMTQKFDKQEMQMRKREKKKNLFQRFKDRKMKKKLNQEQIQKLMLEKLPILEGGQILEVQNKGFYKGFNIVIIYEKDNQKYQIDARYKPRKHKIVINKLNKVEKNPLQIGQQLIENLLEDILIPEKQPIVEEKQSIFQDGSFEKLFEKVMNEAKKEQMNPILIRSPQDVSEKLQIASEQQPLLGSEGEPEMPILLGSEGEPEMPKQLLGSEGQPQMPALLGSEGEPERQQQLLGSEDEPQMPKLLGSEGEPEAPKNEENDLLEQVEELVKENFENQEEEEEQQQEEISEEEDISNEPTIDNLNQKKK